MSNEIKLTHEQFHNKEFCDEVRRLGINSPMEPEKAMILLDKSNDIKRDGFIIEKLSRVNYSFDRIQELLNILNSV